MEAITILKNVAGTTGTASSTTRITQNATSRYLDGLVITDAMTGSMVQKPAVGMGGTALVRVETKTTYPA
eukprot:CAMPEP_0178721856 /NCGR_PEP_ID=MMETSP0699-20121125/24602_1 /TAXON_ID=265572 /ORGANISM="Extubocellulus spinifer, Strain CCMP396" /LENGTH=69 /DNA_ID=CAMNT_0020372629 /DNA_START=57 /DNA_END=262 /DNA_ORIENTATION=+